MVFPDVRTVLGLDALAGHAGAHDLRQAVDIDGIDAEALLDLAPHFVGPGLGAEDADAQAAFGRLHALLDHLVGDGQHVGRGSHDHGRLEVLDQLHLLFGLAAGHRDHRGAQGLAAVVGAEAAGETGRSHRS
jgi:hypothetical protein